VGLDSEKVALIILVTETTQEIYSFHLPSMRVLVATQLSWSCFYIILGKTACVQGDSANGFPIDHSLDPVAAIVSAKGPGLNSLLTHGITCMIGGQQQSGML